MVFSTFDRLNAHLKVLKCHKLTIIGFLINCGALKNCVKIVAILFVIVQRENQVISTEFTQSNRKNCKILVNSKLWQDDKENELYLDYENPKNMRSHQLSLPKKPHWISLKMSGHNIFPYFGPC